MSNSNSIVFFTTDHFILFTHSSRMFYYFVCSHVHVVGSCPAMLDAGRLPVVCLLVATGDIGLSPHIRVRPVMSHFLYHLVCGECCCSNLCLLTADAWSLSLICSSVADPTCVPCDPSYFLRLLVHSQLALNSGCL